MTVRIVNRDEVISTRIKRAKDQAAAFPNNPPVDEQPFVDGTRHTVEFSWEAAAAHVGQGGSTEDLKSFLVKEVLPRIANEFSPEEVDVDIHPQNG